MNPEVKKPIKGDVVKWINASETTLQPKEATVTEIFGEEFHITVKVKGGNNETRVKHQSEAREGENYWTW